jgi:hypothetical protein
LNYFTEKQSKERAKLRKILEEVKVASRYYLLLVLIHGQVDFRNVSVFNTNLKIPAEKSSFLRNDIWLSLQMDQLEPALLAEIETSNIAMAEKQRIRKEIERMKEELARKANTLLPALKTEMTNTEVIASTQNLCGVDVSICKIYPANRTQRCS